MKKQLYFLAVLLVAVSACRKPKPIEIPDPPTPGNSGPYASGVFVICEGPFPSGSGTVTHYDPVTRTVTQDIFAKENNRPAGSLLQSGTAFNGRAFLVVNNASRLEVVNGGTYKSIGVVEGLVSPRYFTGYTATRGYVSDWGLNGVAVINPMNYEITGTILTGAGPEQMLVFGSKLYVVNGGDWSVSDSTVSVINPESGLIEDEIVVGDKPNSIVVDKNGKIWVLCGGISDWTNPANDTPGRLVRIDPVSGEKEAVLDFTSASHHPNKMTISNTGDVLYFLSDLYGGSLYAMNISSATLPGQPLINRAFYGIGCDSEGDIYGADPVDFAQDGWVIRYTPDGLPVDSFRTGIIPGNFYFR